MDAKNLIAKPEEGYELLDSGNEEKLERFGSVVLSRPDPQALWEKKMPTPEWRKAHGWYERSGKGGKWHMKEGTPKEWNMSYGGLQFLLKPTSFKHTGIFPEQAPNWEWIDSRIRTNGGISNGGRVKVLNLFGYTGGATLAAAHAGAEVVHLDASKTAVTWAKENAELSGLKDAPIRYITEDAQAFVRRELKRGNRYDGIIMDPPAFGHGPKDELWKIEEHFLPFLGSCKKLLSEKPLFFLVNGYAAGYSHHAFRYNLESLLSDFGGEVESGELTIEESKTGRVLPSGIYARWNS
jgi:23S rRNA (cytosine1962-C5)-methyltransferase